MPDKENGYCPKLFQGKLFLYCAACLLVLKIAISGFYVYFPKDIFFANITRIDLNNLANQSRKAFGLNPLAENGKLNRAAYLKAKDMVEKEYFSHQGPDGKSPWEWFAAKHLATRPSIRRKITQVHLAQPQRSLPEI